MCALLTTHLWKRPAKLPSPQMKDTNKNMKADKCCRAKVTNWPTRESHLHFKRLCWLLADSPPSKTCFSIFLTKQQPANRSVLADTSLLMSSHMYWWYMHWNSVVLQRNSTYSQKHTEPGFILSSSWSELKTTWVRMVTGFALMQLFSSLSDRSKYFYTDSHIHLFSHVNKLMVQTTVREHHS